MSAPLKSPRTLPQQNPGSMEPPFGYAVGTGSRPTASKVKIATSMDGVDPKTLGRDVPGSLK